MTKTRWKRRVSLQMRPRRVRVLCDGTLLEGRIRVRSLGLWRLRQRRRPFCPLVVEIVVEIRMRVLVV